MAYGVDNGSGRRDEGDFEEGTVPSGKDENVKIAGTEYQEVQFLGLERYTWS
jgi:hypothetical protein